MLEIGKNLRKKKKITQKELADKLCVSPQTISKWELNKSYPDLDNLIKLSKFFSVSTDSILGNKRKRYFHTIFNTLTKEMDSMKLENTLDSYKEIKDAYFVSEMDRLDYQGSALVNVVLSKENLSVNFEDLKKEYPEFNWLRVTMNELFQTLDEDQKVIIIISLRAKAYKNAIKKRYPNAYIISQII